MPARQFDLVPCVVSAISQRLETTFLPFSSQTVRRLWTKYPRLIARVAQRLFITAWMLPLALLGGVLLKAAGYGRFLVILLAIPLYYLAAQSFLHTEYRYLMAMQPSLFVLVAVTLYWSSTTLARIIRDGGRIVPDGRNQINR